MLIPSGFEPRNSCNLSKINISNTSGWVWRHRFSPKNPHWTWQRRNAISMVFGQGEVCSRPFNLYVLGHSLGKELTLLIHSLKYSLFLTRLLTLSVTYNSISLFYATLFYPLPPSLTHVRTHALKNSNTLLLTYIVLTHTITTLSHPSLLYASLFYWLPCSSTHTLNHSHPITHSLTHSLTHGSLTHSHTLSLFFTIHLLYSTRSFRVNRHTQQLTTLFSIRY